jgi:Flp pilus assembly pilin Flp
MIGRETPPRERTSKNRSLVHDTKGATTLEYVILTGVVALLSIQAFSGFAGKVDTTMKEQMLDPAKMGL